MANPWLEAEMKVLPTAEAREARLALIDAAHRFARATGAPLGTNVVAWAADKDREVLEAFLARFTT